MSVKIELSDYEARTLRDRWAEELLQHQGAADDLAKKIAAIDAQLNGQDSPTISKSGKRKKGENLRTISLYLEGVGVRGATVAEIGKKTTLPISSCNAVLKRHDDVFVKSATDSLWRLVPRKMKNE